MFGIPDYGSGATEHWGIITYRESRMLYTPGVSSYSNQRSTAGIIAHECAHLVCYYICSLLGCLGCRERKTYKRSKYIVIYFLMMYP